MAQQVVIFGASGFLGQALTDFLLEKTDWRVAAAVRTPEEITKRHDRLSVIQCDITKKQELETALEGADIAYYFVHMMGLKHTDFAEAEIRAARQFAEVAGKSSLKKLIYMGGLGDNAHSHSKHLTSRHKTGEILRKLPITIELRASLIIAKGSVAFDIICRAAKTLPIMVLPPAASTLTQPIALSDASQYLHQAALLKNKDSLAVDIGGPTTLSYGELYHRYAIFAGKWPLAIKLPWIPRFASSIFLNLMLPRSSAKTGSIMLASMDTAMIMGDNSATRLFPDIRPIDLEKAFEEA